MSSHRHDWSRRRPDHPRFPLRVPAEAASPALPEPITGGQCLDLSRGGAGLRLGSAIAVGAPVRLTLRLRNVPPLDLKGRIAWVRPHADFPGWTVGIQFDDELSSELVAEIADGEYPPWGRGGRGDDVTA